MPCPDNRKFEVVLLAAKIFRKLKFLLQLV